MKLFSMQRSSKYSPYLEFNFPPIGTSPVQLIGFSFSPTQSTHNFHVYVILCVSLHVSEQQLHVLERS